MTENPKDDQWHEQPFSNNRGDTYHLSFIGPDQKVIPYDITEVIVARTMQLPDSIDGISQHKAISWRGSFQGFISDGLDQVDIEVTDEIPRQKTNKTSKKEEA